MAMDMGLKKELMVIPTPLESFKSESCKPSLFLEGFQ